MSDPLKEVVAGEEVKTEVKPVEEVKTETKPDGEVLEVLKEIKESLQKPGEPAPSREQIRAALKDKTGFTDDQLDVVEKLVANSAAANETTVASLQEKVAWSEFKDEIGGIDSSIEKTMKEELKQYDVRYRGDKVLIQKVYYMAKGIEADKLAKQRKADPTKSDNPSYSDNIVRRTIVTDTPGSAKGLDGTVKPNNGPQLSDDEKIVAKKMGVSDQEYARAKTTKIVSQLKGAA